MYLCVCVCVCVCVSVCECVCVWLGSSHSLKDVSINNQDKFCLYNLFKILSSFLEGSERARDNFGKSIYQFQPETKTLERI